MAERTKLEAYIVFSFLNTFIFCIPSHWVWAKSGWLNRLGMVDVAGAGPVHLVGGLTGLVATLMLKPRYGRYESKHPPPMGSPTNALLGMFMLWYVHIFDSSSEVDNNLLCRSYNFENVSFTINFKAAFSRIKACKFRLRSF